MEKGKTSEKVGSFSERHRSQDVQCSSRDPGGPIHDEISPT